MSTKPTANEVVEFLRLYDAAPPKIQIHLLMELRKAAAAARDAQQVKS